MANQSRKRELLLQSALNALKQSAQFCKRFLDEEPDAESILEELQNTALEYCQMDAEYKQFEMNIQNTDNFFKDNLEVDSIEEKFDEITKNNKIPNDETLLEHPVMIEFLKCLEEVEFEKNNEVDNEEFTPPVDPVTKNPIKNPVKNPQCGHVYDLDSITELIGVRKNTRCPYIGCPALQYINLNHLVVDEDLKRKINRYNY